MAGPESSREIDPDVDPGRLKLLDVTLRAFYIKEEIMKDKKSFWRKRTVIGWTLLCLVAGLTAAGLLCPVSSQEAQSSPVPPAVPASFSELVKKASPSVVNINVVKVVKGRGRTPLPLDPDDPLRDFFERYFGEQMPKDFKQRGLGTGLIIDKDGFVLTNHHVVESAEEIVVTLADKRELVGKIIGRDPKPIWHSSRSIRIALS